MGLILAPGLSAKERTLIVIQIGLGHEWIIAILIGC